MKDIFKIYFILGVFTAPDDGLYQIQLFFQNVKYNPSSELVFIYKNGIKLQKKQYWYNRYGLFSMGRLYTGNTIKMRTNWLIGVIENIMMSVTFFNN